MPTRDEAWPQGTPGWIDVMVDDAQEARDYYAGMFGWDIQDGPPEAGGYLMALKNGRPVAGIMAKGVQGSGMPSVWTTYLSADDADATSAAITRAGGEVQMPAMDVMDVGRMLMATDPTGAAFGVWQARAHPGAGVYNEDGAYCWNELHTGDYAAAKDFYAAVFGYSYQEIGGGGLEYSTFTLPGGDGTVGGITHDTTLPQGHPPYWLTWFQADDTDAATARATELGSTVLMGPDDTPFGRMTVVRAPQGEVFGLITPPSADGPG